MLLRNWKLLKGFTLRNSRFPPYSAPEPDLLDSLLLPERAEDRQNLLADCLAQSSVGSIETLRLSITLPASASVVISAPSAARSASMVRRDNSLNLMNYPALTTGMVTMPRGVGSMAAMFLVAPLINRVDNRLIILFGLLLCYRRLERIGRSS